MTRRRPNPQRAGFTLIEIAVVLVIIGLTYGLVTPAFTNFIAGTRLESAARQLAMALREARSSAIVSGEALQFAIDPSLPGWRFGDRHGEFDRRVAISLEGGNSEIAFYPDGYSTGGRIKLESAGRGRLIELHWLTGRVSQSSY